MCPLRANNLVQRSISNQDGVKCDRFIWFGEISNDTIALLAPRSFKNGQFLLGLIYTAAKISLNPSSLVLGYFNSNVKTIFTEKNESSPCYVEDHF